MASQKDKKQIQNLEYDTIFSNFIQACTSKGIVFDQEFQPYFYIFYWHCQIPYRANIRTSIYDKRRQLDIKLNTSHNTEQYGRINPLTQIKEFLTKVLKDFTLRIYYNQESKRCDIKAFSLNPSATFYQIVCITYEPGFPEWDAEEDIFKISC